MFQSNSIRSISHVVHSWMSYLYEVSETPHLAAESSLRYPITGFLERQENVEIAMEAKHSFFPEAQIDFAWKLKDEDSYMEMKYVRDQSIDVSSIFDDIFRLALIPQNHLEQKQHRFFLICGKTYDFVKRVQHRMGKKAIEESSLHIEQSGENIKYVFDNILSFEIKSTQEGVKDVNVKEFTFDTSNIYYRDFVDRYKQKCITGNVIPETMRIRTTLLEPIDLGLKSAVAIWEIERV